MCKGGEDERVKPLSTHNNRPRNAPGDSHFQGIASKSLVCTFVVSTLWDCPMEKKHYVFQPFQGINRLGFSSGRCWLVVDLCSLTSCVCLQDICSAQTQQGDAAGCAVGQHNWWEAFLAAHHPSLEDQSALGDEIAQLVPIKLLPQTQSKVILERDLNTLWVGPLWWAPSRTPGRR